MEGGYRVVHDLDESAWREFVENNDGGIFSTPEMHEVFGRAKLHEPRLWAAVDESDKPAALFLAVDISVFGSAPLKWLSTRSVVFGGPVARGGADGNEALTMLIDGYGSRSRGILFTEFRNVVDTRDLQEALEPKGVAFEDHLNFLIDLSVGEESLWGQIKSSAQRNIRKAEKGGVTIEPVTDRAMMPAVYEILTETYHRIEVPLPDISLFDAAFDVLHPRGELTLLGAFHEGELIAVLFLLLHGGVATYWYTGSLRQHGKLRANDLLVWEGIRSAARAGADLFDFGGAGKPDEDYGVRDFKAKFGGDLVNFGRNMMVHAPIRLKVSTVAYERLSRFL